MGPLLLPSRLYTILHCTAWFSLPVFFNHIHKVSICLFSDVFEPQRKESGLIQTHSTPSSLLLQHFIKRGLTIAELFFLWRTQKSILSLRTVSSWSLNDRKQNIYGEHQWLRKQTEEISWSKSWKKFFPQQTELLPDHVKDLTPPALKSFTSSVSVCLFRCCLFAFYVPSFQEAENQVHFHARDEDQPQAQISFTHLKVKILLKSFLNTYLNCANFPQVMRKLTLPALADPSADHYSPAAFPDRGSSFLLPVGTALCASHHATKKIILQIKLHFLH